jgi:predicted double-glycine peptidase
MNTSTLHSFFIRSVALITSLAFLFISYPPVATAASERSRQTSATYQQIEVLQNRIVELRSQLTYLQSLSSANILLLGESAASRSKSESQTVPFYSQFTDITKPGWQKIGCGIASVAMLIDYYSDEHIDVDRLLERGIANNAYLSDAGWIHSGLIGLSQSYGLDGRSMSLAHLSSDAAVNELTKVLTDGPVMASVHYTFQPSNPIPHLVVINAITDGTVYYNDPAEAAGNGSLSIEQFKRGWKQRYIVIRPV